MNLEEHADDEYGMKVWLSQEEVETLVGWPDELQKEIAFALGARSGLRSKEILDVAPEDVVDSDAGYVVRVWDGKGSKYREAPIPENLAKVIETAGEYNDGGPSEPVIEIDSTRSLRRWIKSARDELAEETGERGWRYLSMHDLRRTWAVQLRNSDVDAEYAIDWGGWEDLETFLEHYKGKYSPEAQRRQREKVDWL